MKRIIPILIGLLMLVAFAWTIAFLYNKSQAKAVEFKTESPFRTDIVKKTVATGAIVPREEVEIKPRVSGVVEQIHVEPGQRVSEGDLIATIQIIPDVASLARAEAGVKTARINFENAEREYQRHQQLLAQGVISQTELNKYELDYQLRREELATAEDNLQLVRKGSSRRSKTTNTLVRSTVNGMVLEVPVKVGASVIESNTFNAGTTIATVANMGDMIFQGTVDESEVGKIKEGMPLKIRIAALEKELFDGTLEYIAPKGMSKDGAIQFEIKAAMAPRDDVFIRANYSANADIVLDERKGVLAINESLLQFDGDTAFVEVETAPQTFEKRTIEVGLSDGIKIEVLSGIDESARIKRPQAGAAGPPRRGRRGR